MRRAFISLIVVALLAGAAACGPSQECRDYVACQKAIDLSVDVTPWDEGGSCWVFPQSAQTCTQQCIEALAALRELPNLPEECQAD